MQKEWLVKTLALIVVVLFISISYHPIIAENTTSVGKESDYNNVDFEQAKEYLFQTIIKISNNPDVRNLFEQCKYKRFTSEYNYRSVFSQLFLKKPRLLFSILSTKPSITYDYLNKSYNEGIDCINIIGEKQAFDMLDSIKISNPDLMDELNNFIKNNEELSDKIEILEIMNNEVKSDSPLKEYPIFCAYLTLMALPIVILFFIFVILVEVDFIQQHPALYNLINVGFLALGMLLFILFALSWTFCD